jgi:hypothetical protein
MNSDRRGPWYLVTGLILGVVLGLAYAWLVSPVAYTDNPPLSLRTDYKDQYRVLIALAYASNGDLGRARARLSLLGEAEPGPVVANQAVRAAAENRPPSEVQALALLAEALGSPVDLNAAAPVTETQPANPTSTPGPAETETTTPEVATLEGEATPPAEAATDTAPQAPTTTPEADQTQEGVPVFTPLPTLTPTATPGAPFVLTDQEFVCDPAFTLPMIMVDVFDASGQPVPGVGITITWAGGQEQFFTGLKPEIGIGYADYQMSPDLSYTLRVGEGGQSIESIQAAECEASGGRRFLGSWRLTLVQP